MKINLKVLGVGMVKNGCGHSGHKTRKLAVSSILFFFLLAGTNSGKQKVDSMIFG